MTQINTDKTDSSAVRGGCGMAHSFEALVETGNGGLHGGDLRFDQREATRQVFGERAGMKGGQDFGAGKVGQITGTAGLAGLFQAAIFVLAEAKDDDAVSDFRMHKDQAVRCKPAISACGAAWKAPRTLRSISTATERRSSSTLTTTRKAPFSRSRMPSRPASEPRSIRTGCPTRVNG